MEAALSEWKDFLNSNVYKDLKNEIEERKQLIIPKLIAGNDPIWSDDEMRGRIDELEFVATIPEDIVAALELEESQGKKEGKSFISSIFNNLRKGEEG